MSTRLYKVDFRKLPINICVLAFSSDHSPEHDHYALISRCLNSIIEHTDPEKYRLHIGCNNLSPRAMALVDDLVAKHDAVKYIGKPAEDENGKQVYPKYPLMREMFKATAGREESPAASDWIAWFDDDSYATGSDWLERLEDTINNSRAVHQLGQQNTILPSPEDLEWVKAFPWFNPAVGIPLAELPSGGKQPGFNFICGGFYAISRRAITACSVPDKRLFHNRGDWSTSLALLHKGFKLADFTHGLAIDAGPRRGIHNNLWAAEDNPALAEKDWIIDLEKPAPQETASLPEAFRIARTHFDAGRTQAAGNTCRRILNTFPNHPRSMHLLGLIHYKQGEYQKAEDYLRQAVQGRPNLSHFHNDLGAALSGQGRHAEALASYREAERLADPENASQVTSVYRNIALALQRVGRIGDAMEYHARMLELNPDDLDTLWNRSHIYLARGQFKRGWEGYESRLHLRSHWEAFERQRNPDKRWDGKPFAGKTLLVQDEQGLGDAFQFVRFLPLVKAMGGTVVFETRQLLKEVLSSARGFDEIINRKEAKERDAEFDLTVPLMSVPYLLDIDLDNLPADIPYLHADEERRQRWQQRIQGDGLKVGLVWTGNLENLSLRHRSIELADLAPFLDVPGVSLYSLQFGATGEQLADIPDNMTLHDLGDDVADFAELAAATVNLDLVISVDTAMAHLAGALGCPAWVMLSWPPDWRWLLDRDDSPWYPGMRLFRQEQTGRWGAVFLGLHKALGELAGQR